MGRRILRFALLTLGSMLFFLLAPILFGQASSHSVTLSWAASSSASGCTSTTGCVLTYNVFRGTSAGAESTTPLNSTPLSGLTFVDSTVQVGAAQVTYYYTVEAVETSAGVTYFSAPSNEVSYTFLGNPQAPVLNPPKAQ